MKEWFKDVGIILAVFCLGIFVGAKMQLVDNPQITELLKAKNIEYCLKDTLDIECIKEYLTKHKIKFSRIVIAQIKLESDNLKSNKATKNKNVTGMRVAAQRFTFATNSHDYGAFAEYDALEDCIMDYKAWQITNAFNVHTEEEYYKLLDRLYCKDSLYSETLKKLIK